VSGYSTLEAPVFKAFYGLPWRRYGVCAHCAAVEWVAGLNTSSLICIGCFDIDFDLRPPNFRRRRT
jgi:hypothetical protein